ncbi:MAG: glutamine synthetase beta-grasp domain-containing protein [Pseudomonadota bacterium]|nr:glutamine synthetase beta-grasp domain-containing protein [Pseudomonadota bacterium]
MISFVEYIWLDNGYPTPSLRSKCRTLILPTQPSLDDFPSCSFDGSGTYQADVATSDCLLKPIKFCNDPIRGKPHYLLLCEVYTHENQPHASNHRSRLSQTLAQYPESQHLWLGFEQEYVFMQSGRPLGYHDSMTPSHPNNPYVCGVNTNTGRQLVDQHSQACLDADLLIFGTDSESMPGQWEFQIGYRGFKHDRYDALSVCDDKCLAMWLLHRICEQASSYLTEPITINTDNKPLVDWPGSGCHVHFSTALMRDPKKGPMAIQQVIKQLENRHTHHIIQYGHDNHKRLTGAHCTAPIDTFITAPLHREASIRTPLTTHQKGYGPLEDRRPGANADPYLVTQCLIHTLFGN